MRVARTWALVLNVSSALVDMAYWIGPIALSTAAPICCAIVVPTILRKKSLAAARLGACHLFAHCEEELGVALITECHLQMVRCRA